jgi:hypothetical protein
MDNNALTNAFDSLAAHLKPFGFKALKAKKRFARSEGNRTEVFQLVVLDGKPGYRIRPSVWVRFDDVEDIFHRTSGYEPEYQKQTPTAGLDLWSAFGKEGFELRLKDESDVSQVVSQLKTIFNDKALSYFLQFSSIAAVDSAINDHPNEPCVHRPMPWLRASTGMITAKLTNRANYDALVDLYRETVRRDANGYYLPRFESLLMDLARQEDKATAKL